MTPERFYRTAIAPACTELARIGMPSPIPAQRFMLAIALQESGLRHRRQVCADGSENGPASGFFQFEKAGACRGVLTHRTAAPFMRQICEAFNVGAESVALWEAIRYQDIVAAAAARALIYTLPHALPVTAADGWVQYLDAWRPGKPRHESWAANWALADATVKANT